LLPDDGTGGLALYSKFPFENTAFLCLGENDNLLASIDTPQGPVTIVSTHTKAPVTYRNFRNRNEHLQQLAQIIPQQEPLLIVGDLNIVPWSQHFSGFVKQAGLRDSRSGFSSTYPSGGIFLQIPIDYILYNDYFACSGFKTVSAPGSDHKGVIGEYFVRHEKI
jgi:endonuclease/exonuclease/phosphatase (EEP) superfamily protein YafD